ncbi:MAG: hypothetical protein GY858_01775, partial [Candidatus Omnitrophica bacterium]|nr:hypothetical protein [Candidatus Omnitrophota bacterium]
IEGSLIKIKIESTIETFRGFQEYSVRYLPEGAPVSYPFELDTTKVTAEAAVSKIHPADTVESFMQINRAAILEQALGSIGPYKVNFKEEFPDQIKSVITSLTNNPYPQGDQGAVVATQDNVYNGYRQNLYMYESHVQGRIKSFDGFTLVIWLRAGQSSSADSGRFASRFEPDSWDAWKKVEITADTDDAAQKVVSSDRAAKGVGGSLLGLMDSATKVESLRQGLATDGLTAKEIHGMYQSRWIAPNNYPEDDKDGRVNPKTRRPFSVRTMQREIEAGVRAGLMINDGGRVRFNPLVASLAHSSNAFSSFVESLNEIKVEGRYRGRAGDNPIAWGTIPDEVISDVKIQVRELIKKYFLLFGNDRRIKSPLEFAKMHLGDDEIASLSDYLIKNVMRVPSDNQAESFAQLQLILKKMFSNLSARESDGSDVIKISLSGDDNYFYEYFFTAETKWITEGKLPIILRVRKSLKNITEGSMHDRNPQDIDLELSIDGLRVVNPDSFTLSPIRQSIDDHRQKITKTVVSMLEKDANITFEDDANREKWLSETESNVANVLAFFINEPEETSFSEHKQLIEKTGNSNERMVYGTNFHTNLYERSPTAEVENELMTIEISIFPRKEHMVDGQWERKESGKIVGPYTFSVKFTSEGVVVSSGYDDLTIPNGSSKSTVKGVGGSLLGFMKSAIQVNGLLKALIGREGITAKEIYDSQYRFNVDNGKSFDPRTIKKEIEGGLRTGLLVDVDGSWQSGDSVSGVRVVFNPTIAPLTKEYDAAEFLINGLSEEVKLIGFFSGRTGDNPLAWGTIPDEAISAVKEQIADVVDECIEKYSWMTVDSKYMEMIENVFKQKALEDNKIGRLFRMALTNREKNNGIRRQIDQAVEQLINQRLDTVVTEPTIVSEINDDIRTENTIELSGSMEDGIIELSLDSVVKHYQPGFGTWSFKRRDPDKNYKLTIDVTSKVFDAKSLHQEHDWALSVLRNANESGDSAELTRAKIALLKQRDILLNQDMLSAIVDLLFSRLDKVWRIGHELIAELSGDQKTLEIFLGVVNDKRFTAETIEIINTMDVISLLEGINKPLRSTLLQHDVILSRLAKNVVEELYMNSEGRNGANLIQKLTLKEQKALFELLDKAELTEMLSESKGPTMQQAALPWITNLPSKIKNALLRDKGIAAAIKKSGYTFEYFSDAIVQNQQRDPSEEPLRGTANNDTDKEILLAQKIRLTTGVEENVKINTVKKHMKEAINLLATLDPDEPDSSGFPRADMINQVDVTILNLTFLQEHSSLDSSMQKLLDHLLAEKVKKKGRDSWFDLKYKLGYRGPKGKFSEWQTLSFNDYRLELRNTADNTMMQVVFTEELLGKEEAVTTGLLTTKEANNLVDALIAAENDDIFKDVFEGGKRLRSRLDLESFDADGNLVLGSTGGINYKAVDTAVEIKGEGIYNFPTQAFPFKFNNFGGFGCKIMSMQRNDNPDKVFAGKKQLLKAAGLNKDNNLPRHPNRRRSEIPPQPLSLVQAIRGEFRKTENIC